MLKPLLMDLYVSTIDSGSRAAWILFLELNVKFNLHKINSNQTLDFGHLPTGWPILKDNAFFVVEANTVLRYIAEKLDLQGKYYPKDLALRTKIDMILDWSQHHLIPATETLLEVGTSYYSPKTFQFVSEKRQQASVEEIGTVMKSYFDVLREMEKLFLRDSIYLTGDTITIADIRVACEILYSRVFNVDFSPYPNVFVWLSKVQAQLPSWDLVHDDFEKFIQECIRQQKLNLAHEQKVKKHGKDAAGGNRQPDVYHTVFFQKAPEEVWKMFAEPNLWASGKESEFSDKPGGKFSYHDSIEGTNLYIQANHRLLQSWRHADWPPGKNSTVRINIEPEGHGSTKLIMLQQDVPPNFIKKTDELWNLQFWKPMGGVLVRNILQQIFFDNLSPHTIYILMTDSQACSKLTKTKCEIGRGTGTEINLLDGTMTGKNVELITDVKIVQQLEFSVEGWPTGHESTLKLEISRVAGGTTVVHTQENVPVGNFRQIAELWDKSFWKKMQRWTEDAI